MTLTSKTLGTLGTLVVLFGTAATAKAEGPQPGRDCRGEHRAKMLERFDTNHDGKLDESERQAMRAEMKEHWQARGSHGQPGQPGAGGFASAAFEARRAVFLTERFAKLDVDKNGSISRAEATPACRLSEHFDAIDKNHDGALSLEEMKDARPQHHGRGGFHRGPRHDGPRPDGQAPQNR